MSTTRGSNARERQRADATARRYRQKIRPDLASHGVVVINRSGEACGWVNCLRDPSHWEPGCRAVDVNGSQWLAVGGNDYDGAERWEQNESDEAVIAEAAREFARGSSVPSTDTNAPVENRHPTATVGAPLQCPSLSDTHHQQSPQCLDSCHRASDSAVPRPPTSHGLSHSADRLHTPVLGTPASSEPLSDEQQALIERRIECQRRRQLEIDARRAIRRSTTFRTRLESRLRSVTRWLPQPVQRLLRRIYPRLAPVVLMSGQCSKENA